MITVSIAVDGGVVGRCETRAGKGHIIIDLEIEKKRERDVSCF